MIKNTAIIYLSNRGQQLANKLLLSTDFTEIVEIDVNVKTTIKKAWKKYDNIICIMATGIVVRSISTLCVDKRSDPSVVVIDEVGRFVVSLLSGHIGGANKLATDLATLVGGQAVITTASDVTGHTALDMWAIRNNLTPNDNTLLTKASAKLISRGTLKVHISVPFCGDLPSDMQVVDNSIEADIIIGHLNPEKCSRLILEPKTIYIGIGCNRNTGIHSMETAYSEFLHKHDIKRSWVAGLASIDLKIDEEGMLQFARKNGLNLSFFPKELLNKVPYISSSQAVLKAVGAKGVAEPAAMLAGRTNSGLGDLLVEKQKWKDVTLALARKTITLVE